MRFLARKLDNCYFIDANILIFGRAMRCRLRLIFGFMCATIKGKLCCLNSCNKRVLNRKKGCRVSGVPSRHFVPERGIYSLNNFKVSV